MTLVLDSCCSSCCAMSGCVMGIWWNLDPFAFLAAEQASQRAACNVVSPTVCNWHMYCTVRGGLTLPACRPTGVAFASLPQQLPVSCKYGPPALGGCYQATAICLSTASLPWPELRNCFTSRYCVRRLCRDWLDWIWKTSTAGPRVEIRDEGFLWSVRWFVQHRDCEIDFVVAFASVLFGRSRQWSSNDRKRHFETLETGEEVTSSR